MSIQNEISRISENIASAYSAIQEKGGEIPEEQTSENLTAAVRGIPAGGPVKWEDINGRPDLFSVAQMKAVSITLYHSLWDGANQQTVAVDFIVSDESKQLVIVKPKRAGRSAFNSCGIQCADQEDGALVFECGTVPESDVGVNVFTFETPEVYRHFSWWSPRMTGDAAPSPYAAGASVAYSDEYAAWKAFDGVPTTDNYGAGGMWYGSDFESNQWIQFDFGRETVVKGIKINPSWTTWGCASPKDFKIVGSNDAEDWSDVLEVHSNLPANMGEYDEYLFPENCEFQIYRILCGKNYAGTDTASFGDIQFFKQDD